MRILHKSLIRKLFVYFFVFGLLVVSCFLYFYYSDLKVVPYYYLLIVFGGLLIVFLLVYYFDVVRPFNIVLNEIQALLAGKSYKKIYTDKIDEIGIIAHFFNQVTKGLGEVSYDLKDRERMIDELNVAAQLQRDILPLVNPIVPGLSIVAKNKPATEVGGDNFNILTVKDLTYVYIGDVTGHGVSAGLVMTMVYSLINVFSEIYRSPYDIVVNVNKYIKKFVKKAMYMTMVMLCWDSKNKKLSYVGAGHEHILVYRADSGQCEALLSGGVALGMVPDNSKVVQEKIIDLNEGDFVVLYTDGITEARNVNGEMYGIDRLKQAVVEYASQYSVDGVNYHIAKDVSGFMGEHKQEDDITLIVMQRSDAVISGGVYETTTLQD